MSDQARHRHCRNYAPIDVVKGVCHVTKGIVQADDGACPALDRLPRCFECARYAGGGEYLGICTAEVGNPMTYPDLSAVTCESFEWKGA